jgi:hypothetical protein
MSFDVVIKSPQQPLAELTSGLRYVVARDGTYLERRTGVFHSSVRVEPQIPMLDSHAEFCRLACPPLPRVMLRQMLGFFQAAYQKHRGEAALVLLYHPALRRYRWWCPPQRVSMVWCWDRYEASDWVQFDPPAELPEGYLHFGDAHSHHGPPIPSHMDRSDEEYQDGLHLIVGNITRDEPTWHLDFCIDGQRFTLPPPMLIESLPPPPYYTPPPAWMNKIVMEYRPRFSTYYVKDSGRPRWGGGRYD